MLFLLHEEGWQFEGWKEGGVSIDKKQQQNGGEWVYGGLEEHLQVTLPREAPPKGWPAPNERSSNKLRHLTYIHVDLLCVGVRVSLTSFTERKRINRRRPSRNIFSPPSDSEELSFPTTTCSLVNFCLLHSTIQLRQEKPKVRVDKLLIDNILHKLSVTISVTDDDLLKWLQITIALNNWCRVV